MYLSYLMGGSRISDNDLRQIGVEIAEAMKTGDRRIRIPNEARDQYWSLVREKMEPGFWNEFLNEKEISFLFKFKDGHIKEFMLSQENEKEIDTLAAQFNNEQPTSSVNVYRWLAKNEWYREVMLKQYRPLIERTDVQK